MKQWHPVPRAMIDDELMRRWDRTNPAPDLVVHMVLVSRILSGNPWGRAKLAAWSGLSKHRASAAIKAAQQWADEWQSGTFLPRGDPQHGQQPQAIPATYADETGNNRAKRGHKSGTNQIARALREALTYATPADVLRAYEWYLTASDARWWQDNGCDLVTFCRQKHVGEFINKSQEWSPEIEAKQQADAANVIPF